VSVTGLPDTSAAEAVTAGVKDDAATCIPAAAAGSVPGPDSDASPAAAVSAGASSAVAIAAGEVELDGAASGPEAVAVAVEVSVSAGRVRAAPTDSCLSTASVASTSASTAGGGGGSAVSMPVNVGGSIGGALGETGVMGNERPKGVPAMLAAMGVESWETCMPSIFDMCADGVPASRLPPGVMTLALKLPATLVGVGFSEAFFFFFFSRFRFSWSKWQNLHSYPLVQRPLGKKQQRLHSPSACPAEPMDGRPSGPSSATGAIHVPPVGE